VEKNPSGGWNLGIDQIDSTVTGVANVVIDYDIDRLGPREGFWAEPLASGGIEGDDAVGFLGKLGGVIMNKFRARQKLVHGNHSALDKKGGVLASFSQSVTKAEKTSVSISIRANMGEKNGMLGGG
jgi:hypothetical protein